MPVEQRPLGTMREQKRELGLKSFGVELRQMRTARGVSLNQAATEARRLAPGLALSTSSLSRLELGQGRAPDARLLDTLARAYDVPYETMVNTYVCHVFGLDCSPITGLAEHSDKLGQALRLTHSSQKTINTSQLLDAVQELGPTERKLLASLIEVLSDRDAARPAPSSSARGIRGA